MFIDRIGRDEASRLARNLSGEYTAVGSWETVDRPLLEAGYLYDQTAQRTGSETGEGQSSDFHEDLVRVVIIGADEPFLLLSLTLADMKAISVLDHTLRLGARRTADN